MSTPRPRLLGILLGCWLACLSAAPAHATVTQPDGLIVPIDSKPMSAEVQIYEAFKPSDIAAGLRFQEDADTSPETFSPLCSFTAELLLKESASTLGVGWYNVIPGATTPPASSDIVVVIPPGTTPPAKVSGQSIKDHPNYKGGLIGFALIGDASYTIKFSERKWNATCTDTSRCPAAGNWIYSITYVSKTIPNAFYLGFEDGDASASKFNNDGDYNDYFFLFTGLTCLGGGQPCVVPGEKGICSVGVQECATGGGLTCKKVINPDPTERCDGLDNNCNGVIDDGAICPEGTTCDRGHCTTICTTEFPCPAGLTCDVGRCVDPLCTGVTCSGGTACLGGRCVDPCTDVICPGSQICRVGRCVNPCDGISCDAGKVCQNGACVIGCDCAPCGDSNLACSKVLNLCVDKPCADITCNEGDVCRGGACVSGCLGSKCPADQQCKRGQCVAVMKPAPAPVQDMDADDDVAPRSPGCSCRLTPSRELPALSLFTSGCVLILLLRARRRAGRPQSPRQ